MGDGVKDAKALGEVAASFEYLLGQPPCCLDGDHYCFRRTGKGPELQPASETPERKGCPSALGRLAGAWGLGLGKLP